MSKSKKSAKAPTPKEPTPAKKDPAIGEIPMLLPNSNKLRVTNKEASRHHEWERKLCHYGGANYPRASRRVFASDTVMIDQIKQRPH